MQFSAAVMILVPTLLTSTLALPVINLESVADVIAPRDDSDSAAMELGLPTLSPIQKNSVSSTASSASSATRTPQYTPIDVGAPNSAFCAGTDTACVAGTGHVIKE